jgi:hypothetical protein
LVFVTRETTEKNNKHSLYLQPVVAVKTVVAALSDAPHEHYLKNQKILEDMFAGKRYTMFLLIKAVSEENLAETDVVRANQQLRLVLGGDPQSLRTP